MAPESKQNKHKVNSELFQLLLCVVVIGVFLLVETWLIFYYDGGFVFPLIFGVLTDINVMSSCTEYVSDIC